MEIIKLPISAIKQYAKNAKIHTREQIQHIVNSIEQFGFLDPIGICGKDNIIVEGHGRYLAQKQRGETEIDCIRLDHLTDEERRAYALAHNQTTLTTGFDFDLLSSELDDIFNIDMADFGFDLGDDEFPETHEDDYDGAIPETPKTKRGDMYRLGSHILLCGDSTNADDVARLMGGEKADMVFTDPPYGLEIVSNTTATVGGGGFTKFKGKVGGDGSSIATGKYVAAKEYAQIKGDDTTDTAREAYQLMREYSDNQIIFGGNYFTDFLPPSPCWVIWDKENTGNFADVEMAWTSFDKAAKLYRWRWNGMSRKGDHKSEGATRLHPTQKPVGMIGEILQDFTDDGDTILDLFGGSGSTLIACEQLGRRCMMMEISEAYCDVIVDRWEKYTGGKAELINADTDG